MATQLPLIPQIKDDTADPAEVAEINSVATVAKWWGLAKVRYRALTPTQKEHARKNWATTKVPKHPMLFKLLCDAAAKKIGGPE